MRVWPDFMPEPVFADISISAPQGAVIRTQMDSGPAKQRPRFTAASRTVGLVFDGLTAVNLGAFEAFFEVTLAMGSLDFEMPHPINDVARRFRFIGDGDPYSIAPIGEDAYQVSCNLELLP